MVWMIKFNELEEFFQKRVKIGKWFGFQKIKVINDVINDKDAKQILLDDSTQVVRYRVR